MSLMVVNVLEGLPSLGLFGRYWTLSYHLGHQDICNNKEQLIKANLHKVTCSWSDVHHNKLASGLTLVLQLASKCNCMFFTVSVPSAGTANGNFLGINAV